MKVQFKFDNGTSQIILMPESAREKQLIQLAIGDKSNLVTVGPSCDEAVILVISPIESININK